MTQMVVLHTSMSINNCLLAKAASGKAFQAEID
jgi:hypothetical protein